MWDDEYRIFTPPAWREYGPLLYKVSRDVQEMLKRFLEDDNSNPKLLDLKGTEAQAALQYMQKLYDKDDDRWTIFVKKPKLDRNKLLSGIVRLSMRSGGLPWSLYLPVNSIKRKDHYNTMGKVGEQIVVLKNVRDLHLWKRHHGFDPSHKRSMQLAREMLRWRRLRHENVLPLLGVSMQQEYRQIEIFNLVLPWLEHGNVREYMYKRSLDKNEKNILLRQIACGLNYIHEQNIIHGRVWGDNILITADGRALVTDPGVSAHIRTVRNEIELDEVDPFVRWEAPDDILSKERDIYSFGMLCYEIYSQADPFGEIEYHRQVMLVAFRGARPKQPVEPTAMENTLFELVQQCWDARPSERPSFSTIIKHKSLQESRVHRTDGEAGGKLLPSIVHRFLRLIY